MNVGEFTSTKAGLKGFTCRGMHPSIKAPDGETFASYIRKAFVNELKFSALYSTDASVTLTGNLDNLSYSSLAFIDGKWELGLTITSSNGVSITIEDEFEYSASPIAEVTCSRAASALMPAVQNLIHKLVSSEEFPSLLTQNVSSAN